VSETTTIGVRMYKSKRWKLSKSFQTVETPYGPVRVKFGSMGDIIKNVAPEFEDCRQLAAKTGIPLKEIYQEALTLGRQLCK